MINSPPPHVISMSITLVRDAVVCRYSFCRCFICVWPWLLIKAATCCRTIPLNMVLITALPLFLTCVSQRDVTLKIFEVFSQFSVSICTAIHVQLMACFFPELKCRIL
jgi:hypothetical protein